MDCLQQGTAAGLIGMAIGIRLLLRSKLPGYRGRLRTMEGKIDRIQVSQLCLMHIYIT